MNNSLTPKVQVKLLKSNSKKLEDILKEVKIYKTNSSYRIYVNFKKDKYCDITKGSSNGINMVLFEPEVSDYITAEEHCELLESDAHYCIEVTMDTGDRNYSTHITALKYCYEILLVDEDDDMEEIETVLDFNNREFFRH